MNTGNPTSKSIHQAREEFSDAFNSVAYRHEDVLLQLAQFRLKCSRVQHHRPDVFASGMEIARNFSELMHDANQLLTILNSEHGDRVEDMQAQTHRMETLRRTYDEILTELASWSQFHEL